MILADIVNSTKIAKRKEKLCFECGGGGRGDGRDEDMETGSSILDVRIGAVEVRWEILTKWENLFSEEMRRFTVATGKVAIK